MLISFSRGAHLLSMLTLLLDDINYMLTILNGHKTLCSFATLQARNGTNVIGRFEYAVARR